MDFYSPLKVSWSLIGISQLSHPYSPHKEHSLIKLKALVLNLI